jgi:hypothetical protein
VQPKQVHIESWVKVWVVSRCLLCLDHDLILISAI